MMLRLIKRRDGPQTQSEQYSPFKYLQCKLNEKCKRFIFQSTQRTNTIYHVETQKARYRKH
jgi:hypothetical protein